MRHQLLIIALSCCLTAFAQEPITETQSLQSGQITQDVQAVPDGQTVREEPYSLPYQYSADFQRQDPYFAERDSLHLPWLNHNGSVMSPGFYGRYFGGWHSWDLHKGLNVSLGASVFTQFGKHAYHGAGFTQHLSAMYAMPLTDKLSLAVGGYINNIYWHHDSMRDAGVSAVLGYQFDEHWEAYLYGQKSITGNNLLPYPLYGMSELGDRIGAAVKYNFNPSFSIQVSVEHGNWPHRDSFHDTYMKMVPPSK